MHTIAQKDSLRFQVTRGFQNAYLEPVAHFVLWKLKNDWDDYNELYHATKYFDGLQKTPGLWIDSHLIRCDDQITGCRQPFPEQQKGKDSSHRRVHGLEDAAMGCTGGFQCPEIEKNHQP